MGFLSLTSELKLVPKHDRPVYRQMCIRVLKAYMRTVVAPQRNEVIFAEQGMEDDGTSESLLLEI